MRKVRFSTVAAALYVAALCSVMALAADDKAPSVELLADPARFVVRPLGESIGESIVKSSNDEDEPAFTVHTVINGRGAETPLLGEYTFRDDTLIFTPRFPPRAGVTYRTVLRLPTSADGKLVETTRDFAIRPAEMKQARLVALYPTAEEVPENLLKFYLHFSVPMSRGEVYDRVRLLDGKGKQVEHPFLELSEELWSPDGMRLTLYFDPGRIKRGLKPRELFGPALIEGQSYTLVIDAAWPDAEGRPLAEPYQKKFTVKAPDDDQPDMKRWKFELPKAGSTDPLVARFDEPLDSAMLMRVISVRDPDGKVIPGEIRVGKNERTWHFEPNHIWLPGRYRLAAEKTLEDLAGNSLGRPFEVDIFRPAPPEVTESVLSVPFDIAQ